MLLLLVLYTFSNVKDEIKSSVLIKVTENLFSMFGVKHRITSAYHPQSNGLDELTNQTLKRYNMNNVYQERMRYY